MKCKMRNATWKMQHDQGIRQLIINYISFLRDRCWIINDVRCLLNGRGCPKQKIVQDDVIRVKRWRFLRFDIGNNSFYWGINARCQYPGSATIMELQDRLAQFDSKTLLIFWFGRNEQMAVQFDVFAQHMFLVEYDQGTDKKPCKSCNEQ